MSPDCINHFEYGDLKGPEEYEKKFLNVIINAIPDTYTEIGGIVAKDDTVIMKWTACGNFVNEFFGVQPTGGKFKYSGIAWIIIRDGKAIESWVNWDMSFLFRQLLDEVNTLRGIIPICTKCKKIRDSVGYWNQVESYIEQHSEAQFSHGLCEQCSEALYGDQKWCQKSRSKKK